MDVKKLHAQISLGEDSISRLHADVLAEEIIENLEAGVDSFKQIMESINGR